MTGVIRRLKGLKGLEGVEGERLSQGLEGDMSLGNIKRANCCGGDE